MPYLTFKGLPENIEGLKKVALWGSSLIHPSPACARCRAGCTVGAVRMWSHTRRSSCLVLPEFQSNPQLGLQASVGIRSFASNQAVFFSLPSKEPEDQGGAKGREEPSARAVNTLTHLYMLLLQLAGSFISLYLRFSRPLPTKAAFLANRKSSRGKNKFLFALRKGEFTFLLMNSDIIQLNKQ